MARLPVPGGDESTWGTVLNDFLNEAHNTDGTIKTSAIQTAGGEQASNKGVPGGYAPLDGSGIVPVAHLPAASVPADATTSSKGIVQLAGDLTGTAASPLIANGIIDDANIAAGAAIAQSKINNLTTDLASKVSVNSTDTLTNKTITDATNNITANSLRTATTNIDVAAATAPASGQFLRATNSTTATWQAMPRMFGWFLEGALVVGDGQGPIYRIDANVTILGFDISCKIAPATSGATFDVEFSSAPNGVFTSIFSALPTIATGAVVGTDGTLSTTTLSAGQYIRFNVDAVGGTAAQSVTAQLRMETR